MTVSGVVTITGSAAATHFNYYKVEFTVNPDPDNARDEEWTPIVDHQDRPVGDDTLALWDTAEVPNGYYTLRLVVLDIWGQYGRRCVVRDVVVFNIKD